jgi:ABC-2 type transport system ATP-binding protein
MAHSADDPPETDPAEPAVLADGLGLRGGRGWVFRGVDLALPPGSLTALVGPAGSGRSMLLLAVAGRARTTEGTLTVAGRTRRSEIRAVTAVARVTGAVALEPELRGHHHLREAELAARGRPDWTWATGLVGFGAERDALVGELPADEAALLSVAVAVAGRPALVVVDDVDTAVTAGQEHRVWTALADVAATGIAVLASAYDGAAAREAGATLAAPVTTEEGAHARG